MDKTAEEKLTIDFIVDSVLPQRRSPGNMMYTTTEVKRIALREYIEEYHAIRSKESNKLLSQCEQTFEKLARLIGILREACQVHGDEYLTEMLDQIDVDQTLDYARAQIKDHLAGYGESKENL